MLNQTWSFYHSIYLYANDMAQMIAFAGARPMIITAPGSAAEAWARENGLTCILEQPAEEPSPEQPEP